MAKKISTSQQQKRKDYKRNYNRIQKQIKRLQNRGYVVPRILPDTPKTIYKYHIKQLESITADYLYNISSYVNPATGELVSGKTGKQIEKTIKTKRPSYEEFIIDGYLRSVDDLPYRNIEIKDIFKQWVLHLISSEGKTKVAEMLLEAEGRYYISEDIFYDDNQRNQYFNSMENLLKDTNSPFLDSFTMEREREDFAGGVYEYEITDEE